MNNGEDVAVTPKTINNNNIIQDGSHIRLSRKNFFKNCKFNFLFFVRFHIKPFKTVQFITMKSIKNKKAKIMKKKNPLTEVKTLAAAS